MKKTFAISIFLLSLSFSCKSSPYMYDRPYANEEYAIANAGDVVFSVTRVEERDTGKTSVFVIYRFMKADKENLVFKYEEHYGSVKETPDLAEEKSFASSGETVSFDLADLRVFKLGENILHYSVSAVNRE
ncbi:MAG: hypothetical protein KDK41_03990 [Leptospiraceae bacterium]|nr:hypothetical protein [Leptospiraceae bacterium]